jgi:hypothetical protein
MAPRDDAVYPDALASQHCASPFKLLLRGGGGSGTARRYCPKRLHCAGGKLLVVSDRARTVMKGMPCVMRNFTAKVVAGKHTLGHYPYVCSLGDMGHTVCAVCAGLCRQQLSCMPMKSTR